MSPLKSRHITCLIPPWRVQSKKNRFFSFVHFNQSEVGNPLYERMGSMKFHCAEPLCWLFAMNLTLDVIILDSPSCTLQCSDNSEIFYSSFNVAAAAAVFIPCGEKIWWWWNLIVGHLGLDIDCWCKIKKKCFHCFSSTFHMVTSTS